MKQKMLPTEADHNMIEAAYMLLETMPKGSEERHRRIAAEIWRTMVQFSPSPKRSGLTRYQQRVHETLAEMINENGEAPTYEELGRVLGRGKPAVCQVLKAMRSRGVLTFSDHRSRSLRILIQPGEQIPPKAPRRQA